MFTIQNRQLLNAYDIAGVMKTVPSVYTVINAIYVSIPQSIGSKGETFSGNTQYINGSLVMKSPVY